MTHTLFLIDAYLLIGALVMLLVNELLDGVVTRSEFLQGMVSWPCVVLLFCLKVILSYVRRIRRALSRG